MGRINPYRETKSKAGTGIRIELVKKVGNRLHPNEGGEAEQNVFSCDREQQGIHYVCAQTWMGRIELDERWMCSVVRATGA